jgi:hypothetical protein
VEIHSQHKFSHMKNILTEMKNELDADILESIEIHKESALHHEASARHHHEAVKHHEAGDHGKAYESTIKAQGHHALAHEHHQKISKLHALKN